MFLKNWKRVPVVSLLALTMILSLMTGCNDPDDFDPEELFSLEDYMTDQDYMDLFVDAMYNWHNDVNSAKSYLDINSSNVPFSESVPPGWELLSESNLVSQPGDTAYNVFDALGPDWYVHPIQDAEYNLVRFNYQGEGVIDPATGGNPAQVEYGTLNSEMTQEGIVYPTHFIGLGYQDDYANKSLLSGSGSSGDVSLVYASSGNGGNFITFPAVVSSQLYVMVNEMSSSPDNPMFIGEMGGLVVIRRVGSFDSIELDVSVSVNIRSNGRGDATISVDGIERVRVSFEYIDTFYHGTYSLRETNFSQIENF